MDRIIIGKAEVTREQVDAWNRMHEAARGTQAWCDFNLYEEYKDVNGRWYGLGFNGIRNARIENEGEEFYTRRIKDNVYLYWEYRGDTERWLLNDLAQAYFGIIPRAK